MGDRVAAFAVAAAVLAVAERPEAGNGASRHAVTSRHAVKRLGRHCRHPMGVWIGQSKSRLRLCSPSPSPVQPFNAPSAPLRTEVRNGYTYTIDSRDRTVKVSGALTVAAQPTRSRTAQARAGGSERRSSDDGGHYIAARFNGPTEAFNHFAQDANFNRGSYRALEDQWAKAKRAGKKVTVRIVPYYARSSIRPSTIDVWFTIDGHEESLKFPNGPAEKSRVKR